MKHSCVVSTGQGRGHMVQSATYLAKHGVDVTLVQGWVPRNVESPLVRFCTWVIGRPSLKAGLAMRTPSDFTGQIRSNATAEFFYHFLQLAARPKTMWVRNRTVELGFHSFGLATRRHFGTQRIFHVKSGFGQGGAIAAARRKGMRILVDQSALHPLTMQRNMRSDVERWGEQFTMGPDCSVWKIVLKDCSEADLILISSEYAKRTFVEAGVPSEKLRVVHLGIRKDFWGIKTHYSSGGLLRLVFTGAFQIEKGAEYLLGAMKILKDRNLPCRLDVFGSYQRAQKLLNEFEAYNLPVFLHGHVPQDQLKQHLAEADIYIFPSLGDGFGASAVEGMAAGLCLVATEASSIALAHGQNGFFVPIRSAEAIADRIAWLSENRREIERVGRAAHETVRLSYSWDAYAEGVIHVYDELVGGA